MSGSAMISALLAGRMRLAEDNPRLVEWASARWDAWLLSQRNDPPDTAKDRLVAVAVLSCLEDLPLHAGLMQLLGAPAFRCTVILAFPTAESAAIAQAKAQREGWLNLVTTVSEPECIALLDDLADDIALAVFPVPAALARDDLARLSGMESLRGLDRERAVDAPPTSVFIGEAGGFARSGKALQAPGEAWDGAVQALGRVVPRELPFATAQTLNLRKSWPATDYWHVSVDPLGGGVNLPAADDGDELIVRTARDRAHTAVVARRSPRLFGREDPLRLRMPASLLTTSPQVILLEEHKSDGTVTGTELLYEVPPSRLEPWMLSAFLNRGGGGNPVIRAFAKGVGCRLAYAEDEPGLLSEIPVVWGVLRESDRILAQAKAQQLYFFYIDHAYFHRGHGNSYRISRNRYEAGPVRDCPPDRFERLDVDVRPWRDSGTDIIVCPPTEYFMQAHDCADWLDQTLATLEKHTDRPVIVRVKPQPGETAVPLEQALETAHALVTHSSNVAIEAACLGTPVFVEPASAAVPVGLTDLRKIESPVYPDREPWLAHLAYNEFSFEEIEEGTAWRLLMELEERDLV